MISNTYIDMHDLVFFSVKTLKTQNSELDLIFISEMGKIKTKL